MSPMNRKGDGGFVSVVGVLLIAVVVFGLWIVDQLVPKRVVLHASLKYARSFVEVSRMWL